MSVVIEACHLSKEYYLGTLNHKTLYHELQSFWARFLNRDDPNTTIGLGNVDENRRSKAEKFFALNNVSFQVRQGECVAVLGRNGAGKSTLLKVLSRVTIPTSGHVKVKGKVSSLLEVGTGFHPELTGYDNIYLNGAILGMKRHEIKRKVDEIIAFSEIEQFIDMPVKRYSSGMYIRLAFSIAVHFIADIVILDEVLSVGDQFFVEKSMKKMEQLLKNEGRTVLFVSHSLPSVSKLCDHGIFMQQGRLICGGGIEEVIDRYVNPDQKDDLRKPGAAA